MRKTSDIDVLAKGEVEQEYRGVIHYILLDQSFCSNHNDVSECLGKLLQTLEALCRLHNCMKV